MVDKTGMTAVMHAAKLGHVEITDALLKAKAFINTVDHKGQPLIFFREEIHIFFNSFFCPLQFFDVLRQNGCCKIPQGPPFQFFGIGRLFFYFFSPKGPPLTATEMLTISEMFPLLARQGLALTGPGAPLGPFFLVFRFSSTVN